MASPVFITLRHRTMVLDIRQVEDLLPKSIADSLNILVNQIVMIPLPRADDTPKESSHVNLSITRAHSLSRALLEMVEYKVPFSTDTLCLEAIGVSIVYFLQKACDVMTEHLNRNAS